MTDPFAGDPWATDTPVDDPWGEKAMAEDETAVPDEAQTTQTKTPKAEVKKERPVSNETTQARLTATIKFGAGFDAPWLVVYGDTPQEVEQLLGDSKGLMELIAKAAKYAKTLDSGTAPAAPRGGGNGGGFNGGQRHQPTTPPGLETKTCAHGEMTYRTGNGAKGPWQAFFCPLDRNDPNACKPIWVRDK